MMTMKTFNKIFYGMMIVAAFMLAFTIWAIYKVLEKWVLN